MWVVRLHSHFIETRTKRDRKASPQAECPGKRKQAETKQNTNRTKKKGIGERENTNGKKQNRHMGQTTGSRKVRLSPLWVEVLKGHLFRPKPLFAKCVVCCGLCVVCVVCVFCVVCVSGVKWVCGGGGRCVCV